METETSYASDPFFDSDEINTAGIPPSDDEAGFLGNKVFHLLAFFAICLLIWVVLSLCCNRCAEKQERHLDEKTELRPKETVIVKELRPGLVLVQGYPSREDTFRIIQEYEAMGGTSHTHYHATYNSVAPPCGQAAAPVTTTFAEVHHQTRAAASVRPEDALIDLSWAPPHRPPPYAPN